MLMKFFADKVLEFSKFRTLSKTILKHQPNLQKFVLRKRPNLKKVPPREVRKIPAVQVTQKLCI